MDSSIGGLASNYSGMLNDALAENLKATSMQRKIDAAEKSGEDKKLRKACDDFESYFIKMMLTNMSKTTFTSDDSMFKKSNAQNIFEDMLYEEYGNLAVKGGNGIGLSDMLYRQLSAKKAYDPEEVVNEIKGGEDTGVDIKA